MAATPKLVRPPAAPRGVADDAAGRLAWSARGNLIYGPRKAGTTLFQMLLDGAEDLFVYPQELKLKFLAREPSGAMKPSAFFAHSRVGRLASPELSLEVYRDLWAPLLADDRDAPLDDLIRFEAEAAWLSAGQRPPQPRQWCVKEVGGGRRDIVAYWRRFFPGAKVLFVVRHPLEVASAVLRSRRRRGVTLSARDIVNETLDPLRTLKAQARYLDDPNCCFTAYEDLVADPRGEMERVAAFLGIVVSPLVGVPSMFGVPAGVRTASRKAEGVFRREEPWRSGLTAREIALVTSARMLARADRRLWVDYPALREAIARRAGS
jgi:hypothetical protein